jgi:predicted Zn-ribbon and HTH transcriptional regulator
MLATMTFAPVLNLILLPLPCSRCGCTFTDDDLPIDCPECGWRIGDEYDEARAILEWPEGDACYA